MLEVFSCVMVLYCAAFNTVRILYSHELRAVKSSLLLLVLCGEEILCCEVCLLCCETSILILYCVMYFKCFCIKWVCTVRVSVLLELGTVSSYVLYVEQFCFVNHSVP